MESTIQFAPQSFRSKITIIEAIELASLGFAFWCLGVIASINEPDTSLFDQIIFFMVTEGILLGSWAIYNAYIRIARAGGRILDILIWVIAAGVTGSYTLWAWTILDGNRFLMSKLLYRGDAPVEYAWSARSKQVRKTWEQARKEGYV